MSKIIPTLTVTASLVLLTSPAFSQSAQSLKDALNAAPICKDLKFDAKDVFKLFGFDVPNIPGLDTHVGWDEGNSDVKSFTVSSDQKLAADLGIGCQPSDQGALLQAAGKKGSDVRLVENASCTGTVGADHSVPDLHCTTNGAGAQFLNKIEDLDGKLKPVFQKALATP